MWLWWWAGALVAFFGAGMAGNTSKVEARRRAREALGRISVAETAIMVQLLFVWDHVFGCEAFFGRTCPMVK
jgi:hypothetical protein